MTTTDRNAAQTDLAAFVRAMPYAGRWYMVNDDERPISELDLEYCNDRDTLDEIDALLIGDSTIVGMDRILRIA